MKNTPYSTIPFSYAFIESVASSFILHQRSVVSESRHSLIPWRVCSTGKIMNSELRNLRGVFEFLSFNSLYWIHVSATASRYSFLSGSFNSLYWIQMLSYHRIDTVEKSFNSLYWILYLVLAAHTGSHISINSLYWIPLLKKMDEDIAKLNFQFFVLDSPSAGSILRSILNFFQFFVLDSGVGVVNSCYD